MQYSYIFEIIRESGVRLRGERQKKILGLNSFDEVYCYGTRVRTTYSTATLSAVIHFFFFLLSFPRPLQILPLIYQSKAIIELIFSSVQKKIAVTPNIL